MSSRKIIVGGVVIAIAFVGIAWASGDWSAARSKFDDFKSQQQDLRKLDVEETRGIVQAICEADQKSRRDIGQDASDRVAKKVKGNIENLEKLRDEANKLLDDVISDDGLKDNHDDAQHLKDEVKDRWEIITRMSKALLGANHPVVAFMIDQGKQAHADRERECDASEVRLDSGQADCLMATGETCLVIELKPNNSRAISTGNRQVSGYRDDLNKELKKGADSDVMKKLVDTKSDFAKCKTFEPRIDCYKLCPNIDEDDNYGEIKPEWKKDCS